MWQFILLAMKNFLKNFIVKYIILFKRPLKIFKYAINKVKNFFLTFKSFKNIWELVKKKILSFIKNMNPIDINFFKELIQDFKSISKTMKKAEAISLRIIERVKILNQTYNQLSRMIDKDWNSNKQILNKKFKEQVNLIKQETIEFSYISKFLKRIDSQIRRSAQIKWEKFKKESGRAIKKNWEGRLDKDIIELHKKLTPDQKKEFEEIIKSSGGDIVVNTDSDWFLAAYFIPYYEVDEIVGKYAKVTLETPGVMKLLFRTSIKNNKEKYYNWINIRYKKFLDITKHPTGKQLWEKFLRKNRKKQKFLTKESKFYKDPTIKKKRKGKKK